MSAAAVVLTAIAYALSAVALFQLFRVRQVAWLGPLRWVLLALLVGVALLKAGDALACARHQPHLAWWLEGLAAASQLGAALLLFPFLRQVQHRFGVIVGRKIRARAARANAQADAAHALLALAAQSVPFGHWRLTADGALSWSEQMFEIFGRDPQAPPTATQALALFQEKDRETVNAHVRAARDYGGSFSLDLPLRRPDGQGRHLCLRGRGVGNGAVAGVVVDVTDQFAAAASLREAQGAALQARIELRARTTEDLLTGLTNRQAFDQALDQEIKRALRANRPLALLLLDVDRLSQFNRHYTPAVGDLCLRQIAQALRAAPRRAGDRLARYGGGTFALLLPLADASGARWVAENLQATVRALHIAHAGAPRGVVTLSAGIAVMQGAQDAQVGSALARRAAAALLAAQREGGDRVWTFDQPLSAAAPETADMTDAAPLWPGS
jgi:diguanylate cyclase (GGDEF)-like protein